MTTGDYTPAAASRTVTPHGLGGAFQRLRDPLVCGLALVFAVTFFSWNVVAFDAFGFDFEGTVWDPAKAVIEGNSPYPPPTRAAVVIGNPAVYPPFIAVVTAPLALPPALPAAVVWAVILLGGVILALRLVGVRDWRCYVIASASIPVVGGLYFGNLTLLLILPIAVAWRYRDRAGIAGFAVALAVAAKLFAWPLLVWLLATRRFRAAGWALVWTAVLVLGPWAVIGFDGLRDYPALLSTLQDVYAVRSYSLATIAAAAGASESVAVVVAEVAGLAILVVAALIARRADGDRRSFGLVVTACVVASPIVWPYYAALLFVPIAIFRPRLSIAWLFGQAMAIILFLPAYSYPEPEPCCRPADVPRWVWAVSHDMPEPWQAVGFTALVGLATLTFLRPSEARSSSTPA